MNEQSELEPLDEEKVEALCDVVAVGFSKKIKGDITWAYENKKGKGNLWEELTHAICSRFGVKKADYRTVVVLDGGDWADASFVILDIPVGMDLKAEKQKWNDWYATYKCEGDKYISFEEMLIKNGAKRNDNIEEYWDN